jgi:hypothetical protein
MATQTMESQTVSFEPPNLVDAAIVLTSAADPKIVLAQVVREYIERFELRPDFWQLEQDEDSRRDGAPTLDAIARLSSSDLAEGLYADGAESGGIMLTRFTPQAYDFPYGETYGLRDCWGLRLISPDFSVDREPERVRRSLASRVALVRALIATCPVVRAHIERNATVFAPTPPHAKPGHVLFIADRAEIGRDYVDPGVYWDAWEEAAELSEGRVLLTRALTVTDELDYKRRTYPAAWAMARAARPGLTEYAHDEASELIEGERELLDSGEPTLTQLGYHPGEHWLEFTAMAPNGEHIRPREIFQLSDLVSAQRLPDGRPLRAVRVTFPNRAMAEREARLLHDISVTVQYFSDRGTWELLAA